MREKADDRSSDIVQKPHKLSGFTMIEVILVVALTGLVLAGVLVGGGSGISRQRFQDSVQDFTEFIRRTYSSALYVQNSRTEALYSKDNCNFKSESAIRSSDSNTVKTGQLPDLYKGLPGRSDCAYYGKLLTFDETSADNYQLSGYVVRVYDIVGKIYTPDVNKTKNTKDAMTGFNTETKIYEDSKAINPEIIGAFPKPNDVSTCVVRPINLEEYRLQWGGFIEDPKNHKKALRGSLAIIRSPESNQLQTFYTDKIIKGSDLANGREVGCGGFVSAA